MRPCNVVRMRSDGWGCDSITGVTRGSVRIGRLNDGRAVLLPMLPNPKDHSMPVAHDGNLFLAAPAWIPGQGPALMGHGNWKGGLLLLDTADLKFASEGSSDFGPFGTIPAGAEVPGGAFVQVGGRGSHEERQLLAIEDGSYVVIADHHYRYMTVWCENETMHGGPALLQDLGYTLVKRLGPQAGREELRWTRDRLNLLRLSSFWTSALERRLHAMAA
jgi:hypothetical protein